MLTAEPPPEDVIITPGTLGDSPALFLEIAGQETARVVLFLHGGFFALGSATSSVGLASNLARKASMRAATIDYRLAPEYPYPAALEDVTAAYQALLEREPDAADIALAGESAAAALLIQIKQAGLPQPSAVVLTSPMTDLAVTGDSFISKAAVDPKITAQATRLRVADYLNGADPSDPLLSPIHADLTGLPPLLIQAGSHEVLLDDAIRLADRAAHDRGLLASGHQGCRACAVTKPRPGFQPPDTPVANCRAVSSCRTWSMAAMMTWADPSMA